MGRSHVCLGLVCASSLVVFVFAWNSDPPPRTARTATTALPSASTAAPAIGDAAAPAVAAAKGADAGRPRIDVDLLHWSPAGVAVSSNVDNPRDYPEHLVDGKAETAWNGKTGDLNATITFQVPNEAWVRQIEISAGFDKKGPKGDFFTMNHRITRVKVWREEAARKIAIGDFELDPNERLPQPLKVDGPGGLYTIDILETVPGTNKAWKELVVSELHVMGDPGPKKLAAARMPTVIVGRPERIHVVESEPADAKESELVAGFPYASANAAGVCAAYEKVAAKVFPADFQDDRYPGTPVPPHCVLGGPLFARFRPEGGVTGVRDVMLNTGYGKERRFIIEKAGGASMPATASLGINGSDGDATTQSSTVRDVRIEGRELVVSVTESIKHERYCMEEQTVGYHRLIDVDLHCSIDAKPIVCTRIERKATCTGISCQSFGW